jgi:hypothetical protein
LFLSLGNGKKVFTNFFPSFLLSLSLPSPLSYSSPLFISYFPPPSLPSRAEHKTGDPSMLRREEREEGGKERESCLKLLHNFLKVCYYVFVGKRERERG